MTRSALYDVFDQDEVIAGLKAEIESLQQQNQVLSERIKFLETELTGIDCKSVRPNMRLKTHCYRGHAYTPENTKMDARGYRSCKTCSRENGRIRCKRFRDRQAIAKKVET